MMKPSTSKPKEQSQGKKADEQFKNMVQVAKFKQKLLAPHASSTDVKLSVCVRKRPFSKKQQLNGQIDAVSCANPQIKIIQPKMKVDGISKYIDDHTFTFDNTFNEKQGNEDIYKVTLKPLVPLLINKGIVTCFAYGQTGSGKTYTMNGLHELVVNQLFKTVGKKYTVSISFFELYGGRCLDLLNKKQPLRILEDGKNIIQVEGLSEKSAADVKQLLAHMATANAIRTTHSTVSNDTSSRSHAICQIFVKKDKQIMGKLILVDLAGSERAHDTQDNNRQTRLEGAEINKSLLGLKECIRAMDEKANYVPFRASKLTLILRDSFISKNQKSKIIMIACISPGSASTNHSLNTLRYADRLKDNSGVQQIYNKIVEENKGVPKLKPAKSIIETGDQDPIIIGKDSPEDAFEARQDFSVLKQTLKGQDIDQFIAFQEKATHLLQEQQEIIATHMATIQKDANLLKQESQMVTKVQGDDWDIDSYIEKLSKMTKKKLKIYQYLDKKIDDFINALKEEQQVSKKIKNAKIIQ